MFLIRGETHPTGFALVFECFLGFLGSSLHVIYSVLHMVFYAIYHFTLSDFILWLTKFDLNTLLLPNAKTIFLNSKFTTKLKTTTENRVSNLYFFALCLYYWTEKLFHIHTIDSCVGVRTSLHKNMMYKDQNFKTFQFGKIEFERKNEYVS